MWLINCFSDVYLGAHWPKSVPPRCPQGAPQKISTTAFAYTRTVVWAYANGCLGIRKQLFGRTQTVVWAYANGNNSVLNSPKLGAFSYFRGTKFFKKGLWGAPRGHPRGTLLGLQCPLQHTYSQRVRLKGGTGGTLFFCFHAECIGHTESTEGLGHTEITEITESLEP